MKELSVCHSALWNLFSWTRVLGKKKNTVLADNVSHALDLFGLVKAFALASSPPTPACMWSLLNVQLKYLLWNAFIFQSKSRIFFPPYFLWKEESVCPALVCIGRYPNIIIWIRSKSLNKTVVRLTISTTMKLFVNKRPSLDIQTLHSHTQLIGLCEKPHGHSIQ